jgi:hypothetical protein
MIHSGALAVAHEYANVRKKIPHERKNRKPGPCWKPVFPLPNDSRGPCNNFARRMKTARQKGKTESDMLPTHSACIKEQRSLCLGLAIRGQSQTCETDQVKQKCTQNTVIAAHAARACTYGDETPHEKPQDNM